MPPIGRVVDVFAVWHGRVGAKLQYTSPAAPRKGVFFG
jgi:hypothetical protein